ncbi:MAG: N-6 DNA methylase [Clostridiaceae bacterium]|nr:N-6 DNA methylase [Clostridiaceae bacterium]
MDRTKIINTIGIQYHTPNIEGGEYSYVKQAGSKENLVKLLGYKPKHFKLDIRFECEDIVILVETKSKFVEADEKQLTDYLNEEYALNHSKKVVAMLANTTNGKVKVWKSKINKEHLLLDENIIDTMDYYKSLFKVSKQNDREKVLRNTYALNEMLHKKDIDEKLRSQFVGTTLLYIKERVAHYGATSINKDLILRLEQHWSDLKETQIRTGIRDTLNSLLDESENKKKKIDLLQRSVLDNQKIQKLTHKDWLEILKTITTDIYAYIDTDSSEGQDILNLFFIAFNKYTGKADKNQAFTPDHITDFMCRLTDIDRNKRVFDGACGSGSFLVQAMAKELADCRKSTQKEEDKKNKIKEIKEKNIWGVEFEERAYGLATTNMLIHGDGNSNIKFGNLFKNKDFLREANPDVILMNPPYNAKPISIPDSYKETWKNKDCKEDPTKGFVFVQFLSDYVQSMHKDNDEISITPTKNVTLAVLLPVSAAIGTSNLLTDIKTSILEHNTLEAVFTLPNEIFYPGASVNACCMLFTLGKPHKNADGTVNQTYFGYCKDDGHKKKKNLGRIEQFDKNNNSLWASIEEEWLHLYRNKIVVDGKSAMATVGGDDEWLCEAYMKTDYTKLSENDFQKTVNNYLAYMIKEGKYEA